MKHIESLLAHVGCNVDASTGAVVSPIHMASTFERATDGSYPKGFVYSRLGNPTRTELENVLARLEGGDAARTFSSGMAASNAILQALPPGARVVLSDDLYFGLRHLAETVFGPSGLTIETVDLTDPIVLEKTFSTPADLVWLETPSNPLLRVLDIKKVAGFARSAGALTVVDGTWTTPLLQKPLELGADLVVHSLTKYIAGHSDVLGGAIISRKECSLFERIEMLQESAGAVLDPFSCWLTLRGLRTLSVRLERQCATAASLAHFLTAHQGVQVVHFPGLPSHPGHDIAQAQMSAFGAMISIEVRGSESKARGVAAHAQTFRRATSLGGTESLIEHRASVEGPESTTPSNLLRLSIGLEHLEDLTDDLDRALRAM